MAKSKNQHWVPQFYLKHFAIPETQESRNPQVWIFWKHKIELRVTNIRNVAAKRYLYSPLDSSGIRNLVAEKKLAGFESFLASIWPTITTGLFDIYGDEDYRRVVSLFISILYLRHPARWSDECSIHQQFVTFLDQVPRDENGDPVIDEVEFNGIVNKCDSSDYKEFKSLGQDGIQRMFVEHIDQNAAWLSKILMDKRWAIVFSEDPVFVTSDTPLILENIHQYPFGFSTPGTILFFPMTPTRILMMDDRTDQPSGHYYPLGQLNPSQTNLLIWRNCERFIISPRRTVFAEMCEYAYRQATNRNS